MIYVPTPPPLSKEARELSRAIVTLVGEYRRNKPKTSDVDVQRALLLAQADLKSSGRGGPSIHKVLIIGLVAAVILGLLVLALVLFTSSGGY